MKKKSFILKSTILSATLSILGVCSYAQSKTDVSVNNAEIKINETTLINLKSKQTPIGIKIQGQRNPKYRLEDPCPPQCPPLAVIDPCPPQCPPLAVIDPCPPQCPPLAIIDPCPPQCPPLAVVQKSDPCPPQCPPAKE